MNVSLPDYAAELQTLAEKMTNTIYRAAKVCSYQSASADKLLKYHGKDIFTYFSFYSSNVWNVIYFKLNEKLIFILNINLFYFYF